MDAIGDVKQIQLETRRKAEYIEKMVRPPMGADVELKNEPASIMPGSITYLNTVGGKKGFFPLFETNGAGLPALVNDIKEVQERINRCFFVDIFMAISRMEGVQPRNELELTKRDLERLQVLGPFITLFEAEVASPIIARTLAIMDRRGLLPPRPPSLVGVLIKIDFVSIMRLAQRGAEVVAMKDTLATAGGLSAAAKAAGEPDPIRIIDLDKSLRAYAELSQFPAECMRTADDVKAQDKARAAQTKAAMQQQQALQATSAGVQAAKTLADTQVGGPNALTAILGGGMGRG